MQKKVVSKTVSPPVLTKTEPRPHQHQQHQQHQQQQQQSKQLLVTKSNNNNQLVKVELSNPGSPSIAKKSMLSTLTSASTSAIVAKKSSPATFSIKTEIAEDGQVIKREGKWDKFAH